MHQSRFLADCLGQVVVPILVFETAQIVVQLAGAAQEHLAVADSQSRTGRQRADMRDIAVAGHHIAFYGSGSSYRQR